MTFAEESEYFQRTFKGSDQNRTIYGGRTFGYTNLELLTGEKIKQATVIYRWPAPEQTTVINEENNQVIVADMRPLNEKELMAKKLEILWRK